MSASRELLGSGANVVVLWWLFTLMAAFGLFAVGFFAFHDTTVFIVGASFGVASSVLVLVLCICVVSGNWSK